MEKTSGRHIRRSQRRTARLVLNRTPLRASSIYENAFACRALCKAFSSVSTSISEMSQCHFVVASMNSTHLVCPARMAAVRDGPALGSRMRMPGAMGAMPAAASFLPRRRKPLEKATFAHDEGAHSS